MAKAALVAEVSTKGAKKAERELKSVGVTAKKVESNVIKMDNAFKKSGRNIASAITLIDGPLGGISSRVSALTSVLGTAGAAATATAIAVAGLGFALAEGVQELDRINLELAKTEAILKATGSASGKTALQLKDQAQAIALATLASTQGIQQAQAKLLTFDKIHGQVFDDAINLTQDLATVFGGDAASQATQLGKALQNPVKGLTALNRVGVSFTEQQSDQVKALVKSGETMKAQAIIVAALKAQVGGAGEAVAKDSLAGKIDTAGQLWSEFSAKLADSTGTFTATERLLSGVVNT
ncbi:phage tail length tape measure family protein, partial [bacterium]|nr:phage tail length tape measure family protein [bacterium]